MNATKPHTKHDNSVSKNTEICLYEVTYFPLPAGSSPKPTIKIKHFIET